MELKDIIESGLKAQGEKLQLAIDKFEGQLKEKSTVDTEVKSEVRELSEQYKAISASLQELAQKQTTMGQLPPQQLTAAAEFVGSQQYKDLIAGRTEKARFEVKNTVVSDATTVFSARQPGIIQGSFLPLTIRDVLPVVPVSSNLVNSLRELAWTNNAAETAQTTAKPESVLTFEAYDVPVTTIAHFIKISNQLMADAPAVMAYIDTRLRDGLAQRVDKQLLIGNGTTPNLSGLTDAGNFTAYTPTAADLLVDAINRAKYAMWATGNIPDTVIVNPADWGAMERKREGAGTGQYLYGAPGMAAGMNPFGLRIVLSNNMPVGKFLIASLRSSTMLYARQGATIEMGFVNDDFTKNLITIRAEERMGLGCERPAGIWYGDFTV